MNDFIVHFLYFTIVSSLVTRITTQIKTAFLE